MSEHNGRSNSKIAHGNTLKVATAKELITIQARRAARELDARERAEKEPDLLKLVLSRDELNDLPRGVPMIPGVLNQESISMLVGRDSTYKTFIALDWALCLATGTPWNDKPVSLPEGKPRVLYLAAEGAYTLQTRVDAWEKHHGVNVSDGLGLKLLAGPQKGRAIDGFFIIPKAINLYDGPQVDDFIHLVRHQNFGLVVIDTLRRVSGGADQNGSDMGVIIDNVSRIKEAMSGGSVVVIAHTDKGDNDTRGSSLLEDDSDIVWHSKLDSKGEIRLINRKMKNGPEHPEMAFRAEVVGESLVMISPDPWTASVTDLPDNDAEIVTVLRNEFLDDGATVAQIRRSIDNTRTREGKPKMSESSFNVSIKRLMIANQVRKVSHGRYAAVETPSEA